MEGLDSGYCLVLSGGGAKGVYHIGVWRALKELGIKVDAFVGASIGAIIAGLLAQGADDALAEIGRTITVDSILALPEEFTEEGEIKLDRDSLSAAKDFFRSIMKDKGLDTSPLRGLLAANIDEAALRRSGRDLGVVTVNLSDLEPREVFLDEMEEGSLVDYLMASAAFPGFEQPVIDGKKYVDGGLHDNIPYAMARKRGYRRVIVSDISGAGRNRKPDIEGSLTVYIRNSVGMGGTLDFNRRFLDDFNLLGYLDTMRSFGRLSGYSYFIETGEGAAGMGSAAEAAEAEFARTDLARRKPAPVFPEAMRYDRRLLLKYLECAASTLEVERIKTYSYKSLAAAIRAKQDEEEARIAEMLGKGRTAIGATLHEAIEKRKFDGSPYRYSRLVEECFAVAGAAGVNDVSAVGVGVAGLVGAAGAVLEKSLLGFYPELGPGLAYLANANKEGV